MYSTLFLETCTKHIYDFLFLNVVGTFDGGAVHPVAGCIPASCDGRRVLPWLRSIAIILSEMRFPLTIDVVDGGDTLMRSAVLTPGEGKRFFPEWRLSHETEVPIKFEMLRHPRNTPVDFAIIGYPKCGTTALGQTLARHPAIKFTRPPEDNFFTTWQHTDAVVQDFNRQWTDVKMDVERGSSSSSSTTQILKGIREPMMIYQSGVLLNLLASNPNVKIFVMIRDPIKFVESWTNFGHLPIFWGGQMKVGVGFQSLALRHLVLRYFVDRVLVVPTELMKYAPRLVLDRICDFLDVDRFPSHFSLSAKNVASSWRQHPFCDASRGIFTSDLFAEMFRKEYTILRTILADQGWPIVVNDTKRNASRFLFTPPGRCRKNSQPFVIRQEYHIPRITKINETETECRSRPQVDGACFNEEFSCRRCCLQLDDTCFPTSFSLSHFSFEACCNNEMLFMETAQLALRRQYFFIILWLHFDMHKIVGTIMCFI